MGPSWLPVSPGHHLTFNLWQILCSWIHNSDVIMGAMAYQITIPTIVYPTVYSGADQRKHQAPRHWPLWGYFIGDRWIPCAKGQYRRKCFNLMMSSCFTVIFKVWQTSMRWYTRDVTPRELRLFCTSPWTWRMSWQMHVSSMILTSLMYTCYHCIVAV